MVEKLNTPPTKKIEVRTSDMHVCIPLCEKNEATESRRKKTIVTDQKIETSGAVKIKKKMLYYQICYPVSFILVSIYLYFGLFLLSVDTYLGLLH